MMMVQQFPAKSLVAVVFAAALFVGSGVVVPGSATAGHVKSSSTPSLTHGMRLVMPIMNPARGKVLFVSKGCVACHAINGVGGHDAPPMDAHTLKGLMNPFDFAAKMWNHAPAMIAAQEGAFGEMIVFTGRELADIIAFIHDDDAQHAFAEGDLTAKARKMMQHEHGGATAMEKHAPEIGHEMKPAAMGHGHAPGTKPHKD